MINNHLTDTVRRLIDSGCHYRLEALEKLYAPDLQIVIVQENGEAATFDYQQNMAFFCQLRDNNAAEHNGIGYVTATRRMDLGAGEKKIVFTLMLRPAENGQWQIFREHAVVVGDAV